ncbi:SKP1-like protein 1 [Brachypodium distachyon]|uniref:SKP1-like protein n=1 Tax=Brachypodium distachyon TaxID=15368 RepID=C3SA45_BRADI|nr:SKP1-like protein 1 [Brachypodium distachyon]ACF22679.1 putative skp1 protein [Brachypodium distachyon]KQJ86625.1 hypothetical protein BRADI_4g06720v3 [Brachypodium distachyon]|eukprot:XP_003575494.1 SKP1-like protein 1 [Brachypodium distachyon]
MAAAPSGSRTRMVTLISKGGRHFKMPEAVASVSSRTCKEALDYIEYRGDNTLTIKLLDVDPRPVSMLVNFCNHMAAAAGDDDAAAAQRMREWEERFLGDDDVDQALLYDLLSAAISIQADGLIDLVCKRVAHMIKGKTPQEIRALLGIQDDLTPDQRDEIRTDNSWIDI